MNPSIAAMRIPRGEIDDSGAPSVCVRLRADRASKTQLRHALDALSKLDARQFLLPSVITDAGATLDITYVPDSPRASALVQHLTDDADRSVRLSLAVSCVRFVATAWLQTLGQPGLRLVPVSPPLVYGLPGRPSPWRIVPVPAIGLSLGDWAEADPQCWSVLTPQVVLSNRGAADPSLLGALFLAIWSGENHAHTLSNSRRFRRLLTGRTLDVRGLEFGIAAALPSSFGEETQQLCQLMSDLLQPQAESRPTWAVATERFQELAGLLSFERLISRWRYEDQPAVADKLQALSEDFFGYPSKQPARPDPEVLELPAPLPPQLEDLFQRIPEDGIGGLRRYLSVVTIAAHSGLDAETVRFALERLISWDQQSLDAAILDEAAHLQIAHIHGRYLGADETRLRATLNRPFESSWNAAVATALRARLLSVTDKYIEVSQLCRRGQELIDSMPDAGGHAGKYLKLYFQLLNGIANIGGAAKLRNPTFYAHAFESFKTVWLDAQDAGTADLADMAMRWMGQLARSTQLLLHTESASTHVGLVAFLHTQRVFVDAIAAADVPPLPWYDETRVLPG